MGSSTGHVRLAIYLLQVFFLSENELLSPFVYQRVSPAIRPCDIELLTRKKTNNIFILNVCRKKKKNGTELHRRQFQ